MIDENGGINLSLATIRDTAGTYELHFGDESDAESDAEPPTPAPTVHNALYDVLEFKSEVKGIVEDASLDTSEKIKNLLKLCPKVESSCHWVSGSDGSPSLAPRPSMSTKVFENRQTLANELGDLMPYQIFEKLLDGETSLLGHLVTETERFAHIRYSDLTFKTDKAEMKTFIGVLIFSGYHKLPQAQMYWDTNEDAQTTFVSQAISRDRFKLLKKYIHFVDHRNVDTSDKYWKIRPLYDIMNKSLARFGKVDDSYSIDEQMVPYTGMHSAKQRMKDKSIRFGYKNFWLVGGSGFPYHCLPYCGKKGIGGDPGKNLTSRVTIQLALEIEEPQLSTVYYDNWFASYKLLAIFSAMDLGASCTIQNHRTNHCPLKSDTALKKEGRGSYSSRADDFTGVTLVKWNDNSVVTVGSNIFTVEPIGEVERFSQAEKKKVNIKRPSLVKEYNKGMGNVDVFDGHVASYRISMRGKKWWWPHLINTLDCLKAASYSLYFISCKHDRKLLSYLEFIRRIAIAYVKTRIDAPSTKNLVKAVWKGDNRVPAEVRLDCKTNTHWPVKTKQRRCAKNGCKSKSHYKCERCDVALCVLCFKPYHMTE